MKCDALGCRFGTEKVNILFSVTCENLPPYFGRNEACHPRRAVRGYSLYPRVGELVPRAGVQPSEDARNLTSLRARRRSPLGSTEEAGAANLESALAAFWCGGV